MSKHCVYIHSVPHYETGFRVHSHTPMYSMLFGKEHTMGRIFNTARRKKISHKMSTEKLFNTKPIGRSTNRQGDNIKIHGRNINSVVKTT